jgi:CheY-like chemotaxis protein
MSSGLGTLRILLADDNPHMRAIVMTLLHSFGVTQVREAGDGSHALMHLQTWPADLAIVDFKMAPMDGVEFTRQVRLGPDSRNAYLPIIMMTGHSAKARVEEARDAGVTEFIVKPITAKTLLNRVSAVIHRPRPFMHTDSYFGPDRRRRADGDYSGPLRREGDRREGDRRPDPGLPSASVDQLIGVNCRR